MPDRINDLTRDQISEFIAKSKRVERNCGWCCKSHLMRSDQLFCSPKCRAAYDRAAARIEFENLKRAESEWHREREALIREIAELRAKLIPLNPDS